MSGSDRDIDVHCPPLPPTMRQVPRQNERGSSNVTSRKDNSDDEDDYMPELPPHMQKASHHRAESSDENEDTMNIPLPPHLQKASLKRKSRSDDTQLKHKKLLMKETDSKYDSSETDDEDMYGPALPPHMLQMKDKRNSPADQKRRILGPTLPQGFKVPEHLPLEVLASSEESSDSDDGAVLGPMPTTEKFSNEEYKIQQLELRAKRMKDKLQGKLDESKPLVRESWMTELPDDKPNFFGLAMKPRQFLRKTPQEKGDRSVWTDTPADKERKNKMDSKEEGQEEEVSAVNYASKCRDEELTKNVEKYNKSKRAERLIDMHQKKIKGDKGEIKTTERRPFSREEDLNVNKFDDAQKASILKKAQNLNDRFSAGNRKFL